MKNIKTKKNGNCKGVRCLTDGKYYPAMYEAASAVHVSSSSMSYAIKHKTLCKGKRYAWENETESNVMEMGRNLSEMEAKAKAYDMLMLAQKANEEAEAKRQEELRKAREKRERKIAELKAKVNHQQEVVDKANARAVTETNKLMALEMELEALMDEEV